MQVMIVEGSYPNSQNECKGRWYVVEVGIGQPWDMTGRGYDSCEDAEQAVLDCDPEFCDVEIVPPVRCRPQGAGTINKRRCRRLGA